MKKDYHDNEIEIGDEVLFWTERGITVGNIVEFGCSGIWVSPQSSKTAFNFYNRLEKEVIKVIKENDE